MKTTIKLPTIFVFFAFMLLITYSCDGRKKTPTKAAKPEPVSEPQVTSPPLTKADLTILRVKVEKAENSTHMLIVTVRNSGETAATFNAGCTYDCPGGLVLKAGANVVQGGYIAANSERVYKAPFRIKCAGPPAFLSLKFDIDPENKVDESNENNNKKNVNIAVPF